MRTISTKLDDTGDSEYNSDTLTNFGITIVQGNDFENYSSYEVSQSNSKDQSASLESNCFSASQTNLLHFLVLKGSLSRSQDPATFSCPESTPKLPKLLEDLSLQQYFPPIYFVSSEKYLSFRISN